MSYKNNIINYIKSRGSRENPVLSHEIEDKFKTHGTTVRKTINSARCEGIPICSSEKGYFYSDDRTDIVDTIQNLMNRTMSVEKAIKGLVSNLKEGENA